MKPRVFQLTDDLIGVMIVPEVIEVFQAGPGNPNELDEYKRLCYVKWLDDELWTPQGGLPRDELKAIFQANPPPPQKQPIPAHPFVWNNDPLSQIGEKSDGKQEAR